VELRFVTSRFRVMEIGFLYKNFDLFLWFSQIDESRGESERIGRKSGEGKASDGGKWNFECGKAVATFDLIIFCFFVSH
jgi:hypothetical protein